MKNKTILITGIHGFIGSLLVTVIQDKYPTAKIFGIDKVSRDSQVQVFVKNLLDQSEVMLILDKVSPDYVFHLGGNIYTSDFKQLFENNIYTTEILLNAVKKSGLTCRVIIPGSASEYGGVKMSELPIDETHLTNPVSPYGVSKVWQSTLAKYYSNLGVDIVIARIFNLIGRFMPEGLSLGSFLSQLKKIQAGEIPARLTCGNLEPRRDFIDIEDACLGLLAVAEKGLSGEIYNICSGVSFPIGDILNHMIQQIKMPVVIEKDERYFKLKDIEDIYGSNRKIFEQTGWLPEITMNESCERMLRKN